MILLVYPLFFYSLYLTLFRLNVVDKYVHSTILYLFGEFGHIALVIFLFVMITKVDAYIKIRAAFLLICLAVLGPILSLIFSDANTATSASTAAVLTGYLAPAMAVCFGAIFIKEKSRSSIIFTVLSLLFLFTIAIFHVLEIYNYSHLDQVYSLPIGIIFKSIAISFLMLFSPIQVLVLIVLSILLIFVSVVKEGTKGIKRAPRKLVKKRKERIPEIKIEGLLGIFRSEKRGIAMEQAIREAEEKSAVLEDILREYGIEAKVTNRSIGPSITRFELTVTKGTRVKKVTALSDDIAMNLAAKSVRIEAPIPGKNAIGIEIPNKKVSDVLFGSLIKRKKKGAHLEIVLGKNIVGDDVLVDLRKMPHLLVAGRTGSGKSVGINTMLASILYTATPEDVRFIMIDPKMVELMPYNGIPHLYVPVITDPQLAANALNWAVEEMESRYKLLAAAGVRNLESYNKIAEEKLPYLVIIIDELADLMMVAPGSIEGSIARIAQKARAVGIHLIIATQRPSIDVITGIIKANLPSRISFAVTSQIDSRTILDSQGAEKLLGRGDMLFLESGKSNLVRIQGAYLSDEEVKSFVNYLKSKSKPNYNYDVIREVDVIEKDVLYDKAVEVIKAEGKISTSLLQRKLKVGYSRAARILDQLEDTGVIINEDGEKRLFNEDEK